MDGLIERAQAIRKWLTEAPTCQCVQIEDCAEVLLDQAGKHTSASLS